MLGLYGAAAWRADGAAVPSKLHWLLGAAALSAGVVACVGYLAGWQNRRGLLIGWPVASLITTILTSWIEPDATKNLPGTITMTFAYVGLTCPRWRSLTLVPLGVAAFVVGRAQQPLDDLPTVAVTTLMWVLVAEVPAWLIARLEAQSALLRRMAQTDALTQLLDRRTLGSRLRSCVVHSAVVFIDLDNFKQYNDRHGHEAGDELLVAFANALSWSVRHEDVAFRLGGDEFVLVLVGVDRAGAEYVLDRLRQRWAEVGTPVGFSAGIATGEGQDLMRVADQHMYANKRSRDLPAD